MSQLFTVRDCLTVGSLGAASCLSWVLSSSSVPVRNELSSRHPRTEVKRWNACIGVPSLAFPYGESDYLRPSFDIDCLLALWPLLLLVSLVSCKVWPFDLYPKKLPCNMVYILTQSSIKHPCSTRDFGPSVLSLSLSLCSLERGNLPSSWVVQALF